MSLIEKSRLRAEPDLHIEGSDHPLLNMRTDFLQRVNLEDIHMRIITGKVSDEVTIDMQEFIMYMPEDFKKKYIRE